MRIRKTLLGIAALSLVALPAFAASGAVGDAAPAFSLKGVDGKTYSLADFKGKTVVLEWVNPNCPVSNRHATEKTMTELVKKHGGGEVVWLGINSTNAEHRDFLKPADHQAWNKKQGINYTILYDETGKIGKAYDAKTTPHMYVVDKTGKLAYMGGIDDKPTANPESLKGAKNYVTAALADLDAGRPVATPVTKAYGCSVKYAS